MEDTRCVAEDALGINDVLTEVLRCLPVRDRHNIATVSKTISQSYARRHTFAYKVEGCGVELYFEKKQLLERILRFDQPHISLLAPPSYGKTLMACIVAMSYRGPGEDDEKVTTYRLGDPIRPQDRVVLLVPKKCLDNQVAELEKAYPGCINWTTPEKSPVVVPDAAKGKRTAMQAYCDAHCPITPVTHRPLVGRKYNRRRDKPDEDCLPLSPHNKVIVLTHTAIGETGMVPMDYVDECIHPLLLDALLIVDEAHIKKRIVSQLLDLRYHAQQASHRIPHAVTLSATSHIHADDPNTDYVTIDTTTLTDEKPRFLITPHYCDDSSDIEDVVLRCLDHGYRRVVYTINATRTEVNLRYSHLHHMLHERKAEGVRLIDLKDDNVMEALAEFNIPPGVGGDRLVLVARSDSIAVGVNIHADCVVVAAHGDRNPYAGMTITRRARNGDEIMTPQVLHQLVGRFVRIHNFHEDIPITFACYGSEYRDTVVRLAVRATLAAFQVRQDHGVVIQLREVITKVAAIEELLGADVIANMNDVNLLYHIYPTCAAMKVLYKPYAKSTKLTNFLRDYHLKMQYSYHSIDIEARQEMYRTLVADAPTPRAKKAR